MDKILKFFGKKKKENIINVGLDLSNKVDTNKILNKMIDDNTTDLNYLADFRDFPLLEYLEMNGNYYQHYGNGRFIVIIANKIEA